MRDEDFQDSPAGKLVPTINGAKAFVPCDLPPRDLQLGPLARPIALASAALGEVRGVGSTLANPYMLIRPLQRKEAVASSRMEGTVSSLSEVLLQEAGAESLSARPEAREVLNYVRALEHSLRGLDQLPVSLRLIRDAHRILLSGTAAGRSGSFEPGEFRKTQNHIGAAGSTIHQARFVPPPPQEMEACLDRFERYLHTAGESHPPVVDLALIHYQFEAIHPFPDGNGRVGRLLIPLLLCARGEMPQPLLYLSPILERNRDEYVDRMLEVSRSGAWGAWVEFFCRMVAAQAKDTVVRLRKLQELRDRYRDRLQRSGGSARLLAIVDQLFESPVTTIPAVANVLNVTYRAAQQQIRRLETAGIVGLIAGPSRPKFYLAREILDIIRDVEEQ